MKTLFAILTIIISSTIFSNAQTTGTFKDVSPDKDRELTYTPTVATDSITVTFTESVVTSKPRTYTSADGKASNGMPTNDMIQGLFAAGATKVTLDKNSVAVNGTGSSDDIVAVLKEEMLKVTKTLPNGGVSK